MILLFKLVGNVLDFERVTYILSFDDKRVKEIFEDDLSIDYKYLKKIIQMQIRVPKVDKQVINNIYETSLNKLLILYGENSKSLGEYNSIINFISQQFLDIRDFKRFINSITSLNFDYNHYLYKRDLLVMEYIKLFNLDLYMSIYKKREFFISHDQIFDSMIYTKTFDSEKFNIDGKNFFDELFECEENKMYLEILADLFPYVDKYKNNQDLKNVGSIMSKDESYKSIVKDRRICSLKYFDLYFTGNKNNFILIADKVDLFINTINDNKITFIEKHILFKDILKSVHYSYYIEIFERIQFCLDSIKEEYALKLIKIIYEDIELLDSESSIILPLSAKERVIVIIYYLLNKISNEEYEVFLNKVKKDYKNLTILTKFLYWFEKDTEEINVDGRQEKLVKTCKFMVNEIINKNIDLYDDNNYVPNNIWGIGHVYYDDKNKIKKYVSSIANEHNIFRILNDAITVWTGTNYRYCVSEDKLDYLIDETNINKTLENITSMTQDEEFVLRVYNSHINSEKNNFGENGILLNERKIINL